MVLAQWLERGLGQFFAPDENYVPEPDRMDTQSSLWNTLAPDPNFSPSSPPPPPQAFQHPTVECVHCHERTPVVSAIGAETPSKKTAVVRSLMSPGPAEVIGSDYSSLTTAEKETLIACRDTKRMEMRNKTYQDQARKLLRECATKTTKPPTLQKKLGYLGKVLEKDRNRQAGEPSLLDARSKGMGQYCPDGYTPLLATAHCNQPEVAKILLETDAKKQLRRTDLLGQTASHIAGNMGNVEVSRLLKEYEDKCFPNAEPPEDVTGRTPWGAFMLSPHGRAKQKKNELNEILFSPADGSLIGPRVPIDQRSMTIPELQLVCGTAHLNGTRILNEDAMNCTTWEISSVDANGDPKKSTVACFAVCDGHGDNGSVSKFVAANLPKQLEQGMLDKPPVDDEDWKILYESSCAKVEGDLAKTKLAGGSTAVFGLVTSDKYVIGNVGDSRCILVQKHQSASVDQLGEKMNKLDLSATETPEKAESTTQATGTPTVEASPIIATALSKDHKPGLPRERERIEKAGLTVTEETFEENGQEVTIQKVKLSDSNRMGVSRAFGDFEYKKNEGLADKEQAVVAVPEVHILDRKGISSESYLVLACDGVWDVKTNEDVANFVVENVNHRLSMNESTTLLPRVGDDLLNECIDSDDNLSVILVALDVAAAKISAPAAVPGRKLTFKTPLKEQSG